MAGLLSWGAADYLAAFSSRRIGSLSTALLVQLFGIALPLPFALLELSARPDVDWGALAVWAPLSAALLGLAYLAYYTGLQRGPVSVVSTAASAWLAVTIAVAIVLFGESVALEQLALMAAVLAGIAMLSLRRGIISGGSGLQWGLLAMLGLGVALAFFERATEAAGAMIAVFVTRTLAVVPSYLFIRSRGERVRLPSDGAGWRLLLGAAVLDAGGYVGYNLGLQVAPVAVVAPLVAAHPVATVALAVLLLRERPRAMQWTGGVVVVVAIIALSALVGV